MISCIEERLQLMHLFLLLVLFCFLHVKASALVAGLLR